MSCRHSKYRVTCGDAGRPRPSPLDAYAAAKKRPGGKGLEIPRRLSLKPKLLLVRAAGSVLVWVCGCVSVCVWVGVCERAAG